MFLIRGVLLVGKFRTHQQLNGMSREDQRNTLIVEMVGHSNQSVGSYQALDNDTIVQWPDVEHGFDLLELIEKERDSALLTARC